MQVKKRTEQREGRNKPTPPFAEQDSLQVILGSRSREHGDCGDCNKSSEALAWSTGYLCVGYLLSLGLLGLVCMAVKSFSGGEVAVIVVGKPYKMHTSNTLLLP